VSDVVRAFDQISEVFDATRSPPDPAALDRIAELLRARGVGSLLEIGVGTGRIAGPLGARSLSVTGVDASRAMLGKAWGKGVRRVVQGNAYRLPFRDRSFDGALFVHVLHLLDDPRSALLEAGRVARTGAFALVRPSRREPKETDSPDRPRRMLVEELRARGVSLPAPSRPGDREATLVVRFPPSELLDVADRWVTEPLTRSLDMIENGASRHFREVPPEVLRPALATVRAKLGDRTHTYHDVSALAVWAPGSVPTAGG
jgi:SAM-dependent methyltransferase